MQAFRRDGHAFVARLRAAERPVLLDVVDGVVDLFGAVPEPGDDLDPFSRITMTIEEVPPPQDPALHRLLPDASPDPQVAGELRRLTEGELRMTKVAKLRRLRVAIEQAEPDLVVVPSEAADVAAALTDVRLVLGTRLGLETDEQAESLDALLGDTDEPADDAEATRRFLASVYAVLTDLQDSLLRLMLADLPDDAPPAPPGSGRHRR